MNAIEQWKAKGSSYQEGILLYATFPQHNKVLLKSFQKKESPQLLEKLKYELSKFDKSAKAISETPKTSIKKTPTVGQNMSKNDVVQFIEVQQTNYSTKQALYFHELPAEMRPFLLEANSLFKEMCLLKVSLNELAPEAEEEALKIQIQISSKQKSNALCWQKLDYWKKHKVAPKEPKGKFEQLTPANLVKQEQYLFASISKMKKRLDANMELLKSYTNLTDANKLQRSIAKQENNLIAKNDDLLKLKSLINGEG